MILLHNSEKLDTETIGNGVGTTDTMLLAW